MDRLAETKRADDIHTQTAVGVVQVCALRSFALPCERCAQCFGLLSYQILGASDCSLRE